MTEKALPERKNEANDKLKSSVKKKTVVREKTTALFDRELRSFYAKGAVFSIKKSGRFFDVLGCLFYRELK